MDGISRKKMKMHYSEMLLFVLFVAFEHDQLKGVRKIQPQ